MPRPGRTRRPRPPGPRTPRNRPIAGSRWNAATSCTASVPAAAGEALARHDSPAVAAAPDRRPDALQSPDRRELPVTEVLGQRCHQGNAEIAPAPVAVEGHLLDGQRDHG